MIHQQMAVFIFFDFELFRFESSVPHENVWNPAFDFV